jgi:hypothetical protein
MMTSTKYIMLTIGVLAAALPASMTLAAPPTLTISHASVNAGTPANVVLTLANNGPAVIAAITTDITYDTSKLTPSNVNTTVAGKTAQGNIIAGGTYRVTLYGGVTTFPGGVIATVTFNTAAGECATYPLSHADGSPSASDAAANPVPLVGAIGSVTATCPTRPPSGKLPFHHR